MTLPEAIAVVLIVVVGVVLLIVGDLLILGGLKHLRDSFDKLGPRLPRRDIYPKSHKGLLYLRRWFLTPIKIPARVFLHKICRSDIDKDLHDHPWDFVSIVLKGAYTEEIRDRPGAATRKVRRKRFSVAYRPAETQHRVALDPMDLTIPQAMVMQSSPTAPDSLYFDYRPCWTLVIAFRARRQWGFAAAEGHVHVPWRAYLGLSPDIPDSPEDVA